MNIALIGNPNCGKSTLFNALTRSQQRVGNWPGITVERKSGFFNYKNKAYEIIDLPGTYAIENPDISVSQDEMVVRNYVITEPDSIIINILDATNLQRSLYLTFQLLDLSRPMIVVLNMMDALQEMGESINMELLAKQLGCPVIGISAAKKIGLENLYQVIETFMTKPSVPDPKISTLATKQESILQTDLANLNQTSQLHQLTRWALIEIILDESQYSLNEEEQQFIQQCRNKLAKPYEGEIDVALASARYDAIDELTKQVIDKSREASASLSDKLDRFTLGRITGIPFFLLTMYLMFIIAIKFGSVFIDFFDGLFATIFVEGLGHLLSNIGTSDWLVVILADGIGTGIQTVATFIPVIAAMFFCLSFLEDSGYLARAAMVVDRSMRAIGLPGKAFVPMLIGFGCGVPAIMGTRTLDTVRDRLMSICMIPFMSCGARLPVYALFAVIFFPKSASTVVFTLYLLGILIAILTGFILKQTLLPGKATPFIMELPAYRIPTLRGMLHLTWLRLKSFIGKAGKAIVLMVTVLSILNSIGTDGTFGHNNSDHSVLSITSQTITPVFEPMGITEQNWPATVGIFTGIFAKEAVIATLNSLYSMESTSENEEEAFNLWQGIKEAVNTIPHNLTDMMQSLLDPLGISAVNEDIDTLQDELDVSSSTVLKIESSFGTSSAAMAYLIFILLYTPCAAALGAAYREAGIKWMLFIATWTFMIGWVCATAYYQYTLLTQSSSAVYWLVGILGLFMVIIFGMKMVGRAYSSKLLTVKTPTKNTVACTGCNKDCCR